MRLERARAVGAGLIIFGIFATSALLEVIGLVTVVRWLL